MFKKSYLLALGLLLAPISAQAGLMGSIRTWAGAKAQAVGQAAYNQLPSRQQLSQAGQFFYNTPEFYLALPLVTQMVVQSVGVSTAQAQAVAKYAPLAARCAVVGLTYKNAVDEGKNKLTAAGKTGIAAIAQALAHRFNNPNPSESSQVFTWLMGVLPEIGAGIFPELVTRLQKEIANLRK